MLFFLNKKCSFMRSALNKMYYRNLLTVGKNDKFRVALAEKKKLRDKGLLQLPKIRLSGRRYNNGYFGRIVQRGLSPRFDIRRSQRYLREFQKLCFFAKRHRLELTTSDFGYLRYYEAKFLLCQRDIPLFRHPRMMHCPEKYKASKKTRDIWYKLQKQKIRIIKLFHQIFFRWYKKWYRKYLTAQSLSYYRLYQYYSKKFYERKFLNRVYSRRDNKHSYLEEKRHKQFRIFRQSYRNKWGDKYQYHLKILQRQFLLYINSTAFFLKKLAFFYRKVTMVGNYEKFLLFIRQRIFVILTKIRYFCQYKTNLPVQQRLILLGFVLINGQKIRNPYFSVWILDMVELTYQLYFYEWRYFYFLRELNKLRWYGRKKGFKYLHPYIFKNKYIFADRFRQWYVSSLRCPATIITRMISKFWFYRVLPKFYNFLNLQIIAEIFIKTQY